ncbi:SPW repeat protein [Natronosporangium hydrolyticum]|uniref:SPW repeat protein n=1 Tax=Natronosporangium hydrolyticum TaxID=2811111 RepID=A0A895YEI4_9ACTN|nr:SPW repeat protein [Natronosporangium hydrolyticum]QSB13819.1 SPW repeat protein [Natronosporangium hydrolyticum]
MDSPTRAMEQHPDIVAMRMRYERAAESPMTQITHGLIVLAGVYLAISPWVVGFSGQATITVNNLLTGIAVAVIAMGLASAFGRTHGLAFVVPLVGVWTIITPWVVSGNVDTTNVIVNNVIIGAVLVVLGLVGFTVGLVHQLRR